MSTIFKCPCFAAKCNAVIPSLSLGFFSSILAKMNLTINLCPFLAALCSGVVPSSADGLRFEMSFEMILKTAKLPPMAALCSNPLPLKEKDRLVDYLFQNTKL